MNWNTEDFLAEASEKLGLTYWYQQMAAWHQLTMDIKLGLFSQEDTEFILALKPTWVGTPDELVQAARAMSNNPNDER